MRIQWDAALVGATATALDGRLRGARIRGWLLDPSRRRFVLFLREAALAWELHPQRLGLHVLPAMDPPPEARPLPAKLSGVWSPPDERILVLETRRVRGRPAEGAVILELIPNRENVAVTEGEDRVVRALLHTREGHRPVRRGRPYLFPPASPRAGAGGDLPPGVWERLGALSPEEGRRALLGEVAWTSPLSAGALLDEGGDEVWALLRRRATGEAADGAGAAVVAGRHGPQPYPVPLPGATLTETPDLLSAFAEAEARSTDMPPLDPLLPGSLVDALSHAVERARSRVARLEEELASGDDPDRLQGWGDLLLARFRDVTQGAPEAVLEGFDGVPVRIPLDPTLPPDGNARKLYERAARVRRARTELPGRIREARERWEALGGLEERARAGAATREEVEAAVPDRGASAQAGPGGPSLPYLRFRSSGGLEIRVGRGAARNDDLTFHHARPGDVWLHARHAAGAHVILRWEGPGAPPARDLEEAAVLAALHSRARTSGSVPVDWTLRKHVRKPRKAPAGAVLPDRVRTVFVRPDPAVAERLREE